MTNGAENYFLFKVMPVRTVSGRDAIKLINMSAKRKSYQ